MLETVYQSVRYEIRVNDGKNNEMKLNNIGKITLKSLDIIYYYIFGREKTCRSVLLPVELRATNPVNLLEKSRAFCLD